MCSVKKQIYIISKSGLVSVASLPALKLSLQGTEGWTQLASGSSQASPPSLALSPQTPHTLPGSTPPSPSDVPKGLARSVP